jgi:hypothetical protein
VDGEVKTWDDTDDARDYLVACKEDDKYFVDGAVVKCLPCFGCRWLNWWGAGEPASHCENGAVPSPWYEAARWGGLSGCPRREAADEIYRRTAERQHGPDGIVTKIKARWAELNSPLTEEVTA